MRRTHLVACIALAALLSSTSVNAADTKPATGVVANICDAPATGEGVGMRSCAYFEQDYKAGGHVAEVTYFSWGQGYMTGLNIARGITELSGFKSMTMDQQQARIKQYCDANPDKKYVEAILDLYLALYPRKEIKSQ